jgi:hypothetical protein
MPERELSTQRAVDAQVGGAIRGPQSIGHPDPDSLARGSRNGDAAALAFHAVGGCDQDGDGVTREGSDPVEGTSSESALETGASEASPLLQGVPNG